MIVVAWLASLAVVATFAYSSHTDKMLPFHIVNVVAGVILIPINIIIGASFGAFIGAVFGLASLNYLIRNFPR